MRRSWLRLFWLAVVLVGVVVGYLVSSGLGTRLLHREIETQLSRLLQGSVEIGEVDLRWADGIRVEAREVAAFRRPPPVPGHASIGPLTRDRPGAPDRPPALRARRVIAWVDLVALMIGRLELSTLILEGPHLHLVQNSDGSFVGLPLRPLARYPDEDVDDRSQAEQIFARLASLDLSAGMLADRFRAADKIEIIDGTLSWVEAAEEDAPGHRSLRIELVNGRAERDWLSDAVTLEASGVFVDGEHAPFPFAASVRRDEGPHFIWSLDLSRIPLAAAETPLAFVEGIEGLAGTLDTHLQLETEPNGIHRLKIDAQIEKARIALRRSASTLEFEHMDIDTELVVDPYQVRVASGHLAGGRFGVDLKGTLQRPIRAASPTRIEARVLGLQLEDITSYAHTLEAESTTALTIARLTEHVQSGQVRYIELSGTAPLRRWEALATGGVRELPSGFVLSGAFNQVSVSSGPDDVLENLEAEVEWIGDQIVFRNGNGVFRGKPLPQLDAVINGVSHLVQTSTSARLIRQSPPPLFGLGPLLEIIKPRNPEDLPPVKAIALAIDHLEHPLFRWPLRDLRVLIEPLRLGLEINVRDGTWGGAGVSGEVVWFNDPIAPSVSATLTLAPPPADEISSDSPVTNRWGSGQFEFDFRPRRWLPFQKATGHFRLEGTNLLGDELSIQIENQGKLAARLALGLESEDSVGFDTSFALTGGRLAEIGPFVALPADLATGTIGATGSLVGRVRPGTSFVAELDGNVRAEASDGRVYLKLPLMFRLAKATEGYNPFANEDQLQYETMTGSFELKHGLISVADFEIEGPLRVYARADIDTNIRPSTVRSVVGIFLFRTPNQILENLPVLRYFLPGSERGLIGTYFTVEGPLAEPDVEALPLQSLMSGVPSAIKAPFKALRYLFDRTRGDS